MLVDGNVLINAAQLDYAHYLDDEAADSPVEGGGEPCVLGQDAGLIWIAEDFDAPLPPELHSLFEGDDDES